MEFIKTAQTQSEKKDINEEKKKLKFDLPIEIEFPFGTVYVAEEDLPVASYWDHDQQTVWIDQNQHALGKYTHMLVGLMEAIAHGTNSIHPEDAVKFRYAINECLPLLIEIMMSLGMLKDFDEKTWIDYKNFYEFKEDDHWKGMKIAKAKQGSE